MRQYFRKAIEHGGEQIPIALGKAERLLKKSPKDATALAYKGSLLAMISETMSPRQRAIYLLNGIAVMQAVLRDLDPTNYADIEAYFVTVTSLLKLDEATKEVTVVPKMLAPLFVPERFALLTTFEAVSVLVLDAKLARRDGDLQRASARMEQATQMDPSLTLLLRDK